MNLETYQADLDMSLNDLRGRVLDLGAGTRQFAFDCAEAGLTQVWSLADSCQDWYPMLAMMEKAKLIKKDSAILEMWRGVNRRSAVALMQELPFADNSFDLVVSHNALANVFSEANEMARALKEAVRVGRRVIIFPIWLENWTDEQKAMVVEAVEMMGMKIRGTRLILDKK